MKNGKVKIAILADGFINWGGGIDFLKAYLHPLQKSDKYEPIVFVGKPSMLRSIASKVKRGVSNLLHGEKESPDVAGGICQEFIDDGFQVVIYSYHLNMNISLAKSLIDNDVKCVFLTLRSLGKNFPLPWCLYLPDFQHKYYPKFFSKREIHFRDKDFEKNVNTAEFILVEAEAVKADIMKFYPYATADVSVMPYTAIPEEEWLCSQPVSLEKYKLPEKFFIISNQFWIHKNHLGALEAFAEFVNAGHEDVFLVCTGKMSDYRFPDYHKKIIDKISELKIDEKVIFTGYVSKNEQIAMLKKSIAIIQPTLFEGNPGGGVAYNAISLGLPLILSDIPVNKELKSKFVVFFDAHNMSDLADKMSRMYNHEYLMPEWTVDDCIEQGELKQKRLLTAIESLIAKLLNTVGVNSFMRN